MHRNNGHRVITFASTGALATVVGQPAIAPLGNNSATLTTMGFAFQGSFHKKYKYDVLFPATVQQTAMIFTTGLLMLVDLRIPNSVNKIAVTAKLAMLINRNLQQHEYIYLGNSLNFFFPFEQHDPPAPLGLPVLLLHLHASLLAQVEHSLLNTRSSHLQIFHGRKRLLSGSLGPAFSSLVALPRLWLDKESLGEVCKLVKHGTQSRVSMVKVNPHGHTGTTECELNETIEKTT